MYLITVQPFNEKPGFLSPTTANPITRVISEEPYQWFKADHWKNIAELKDFDRIAVLMVHKID